MTDIKPFEEETPRSKRGLGPGQGRHGGRNWRADVVNIAKNPETNPEALAIRTAKAKILSAISESLSGQQSHKFVEKFSYPTTTHTLDKSNPMHALALTRPDTIFIPQKWNSKNPELLDVESVCGTVRKAIDPDLLKILEE